MQEKRQFNYMNLLLILVFILGLGILLYPNISNFFNERNSSKAIGEYDSAIAEMNAEERRAKISQANEYNAKLVTDAVGRFAAFTEQQLQEYMNTLNLDGNGMMCYLKIDKLGVSLPVYHGTTEDVLQKYVGHIEGTSLPVGGLGTHCGLSGHRGLPSAVLFTNLDRMEVGDYFSIMVLGEELVYVVDQISIVLPDDVSALAIDPEKDYVTLVTCTPYGVNTHRLMVRGVRVPDEEIEEVIENAQDNKDRFFDFTREQFVNLIAIILSAIFFFVVLPLLLFPPVPKRIIILRPWDDHLVEVVDAAIKVSEQANRANWEVDALLKPSDFIAKIRRWDNTMNNANPLSEEDEARKWHEYRYEDENYELSDEEIENYREWDDKILEKIDQNWEPLDRIGYQKIVRFTDVVDIMERGSLDAPEEDLSPHFDKELEYGDSLLEKIKHRFDKFHKD